MSDVNPNDAEPVFKSAQIIILLDLDNNILQSRRKCVSPIQAVAYKTNGEACGYMTAPQLSLFYWLNETALVIPNTARDVETFRRVNLPFKSYSICSFGGVILSPDGTIEAGWQQIIKARADACKQHLIDAYGKLSALASQRHFDIRSRLIEDGGMPLYVSVKHNQNRNEELVELGVLIKPFLPDAWTVHFNDNNLAVFPDFLGKEKASRWLLENCLKPSTEAVVLGSGDSFTDLPFMAQSDFALMPTGSQIFSSLENPESLSLQHLSD